MSHPDQGTLGAPIPTPADPTSLEQVLAENEQLRNERRLLLKALFPPEPEDSLDFSDYFPVTAEQLLDEAHKPQTSETDRDA